MKKDSKNQVNLGNERELRELSTIMREGEILKDDQIEDKNGNFIRIKIMAFDNVELGITLFMYVKQINGEFNDAYMIAAEDII